MTRNLLYRVEVAVQILEPKVRQIIMDVLGILAEDNVLTRIALPDGSYKRLYPGLEERAIDSQYEQYAYFKQRTAQAVTVAEPPRVDKGQRPTFIERLLSWFRGGH